MDLEDAIKNYLMAAGIGAAAVLALPLGLILLPFAVIGYVTVNLVVYIQDKLDGTETVRT